VQKIKVGIHSKQCGRGAADARIEAPKAPKGMWCVEGVSPSSLGKRGVGKRLCPLPGIFFAFGSQNGEFWCILGRIFIVELLVYRLCYNITPVCVTDSDKPNE